MIQPALVKSETSVINRPLIVSLIQRYAFAFNEEAHLLVAFR